MKPQICDNIDTIVVDLSDMLQDEPCSSKCSSSIAYIEREGKVSKLSKERNQMKS